MARRRVRARRKSGSSLIRVRHRWIRIGGPICLTLALSGCLREDLPPPTTPVPTLEVVVATQGPPPVPTPGKQQVYTVREGDTLSGIAARFGVDEEHILKQNPDLDRDTLFVGQDLIIPAAQP